MKYLSCFLYLLLLSNVVLSQDDYYWVGGSGNWSDINMWQLENGTNPFEIPDETDNVIFNENSFVQLLDNVIAMGGDKHLDSDIYQTRK